MAIGDLHNELIGARKELEEGHPDKALERIDRALEELDTSLLTTTQAKEWLGLGSVNTLKLLVRKAGLHVEMHGNRMMIPRTELEKLQDSPLVRGIRAADRLHEESADLGVPEGLSDDQLQALEDARPGALTWNNSRQPQLEESFRRLAEKWRRETRLSSRIEKKVMHPAYQRIIGMGPKVLPLILRDMERRPGYWYWALRAISGEDPAAGARTISEARETWLQWGRARGYFAGEG
jgi:hypothetical protein